MEIKRDRILKLRPMLIVALFIIAVASGISIFTGAITNNYYLSPSGSNTPTLNNTNYWTGVNYFQEDTIFNGSLIVSNNGIFQVGYGCLSSPLLCSSPIMSFFMPVLHDTGNIGTVTFHNNINVTENATIGNLTVSGYCVGCSGSGYSGIPFTSTSGSGPGSSITVSTAGGNPVIWICGDAEDNPGSGATTSYSVDVQDGAGHDSYIGHQFSNGCVATDQGGWSGVGIGITNSISYLTPITQNSNSYCGGQCYDMQMSLSVPIRSFIVIVAVCGGDNPYGGDGSCDGISNIPAGCTEQEGIQSPMGLSASYLYTCGSVTGTYNLDLPSHQGTDAVDMAMAAYVFPDTSGISSTFTIQKTLTSTCSMTFKNGLLTAETC